MAPVLGLEIALKNRGRQFPDGSQAESHRASITQSPMNNVYSGLMQMTDSCANMGVVITKAPNHKRVQPALTNSPRRQAVLKSMGGAGVTQEHIGKTYMNSFMGRYPRQSPTKLKDAEKAFMTKQSS